MASLMLYLLLFLKHHSFNSISTRFLRARTDQIKIYTITIQLLTLGTYTHIYHERKHKGDEQNNNKVKI